MKIIHVITGLSTGGAEMMLYKLLSRMERAEFDTEVISLTNDGPIADKIKALDIPVHAIGMKRGSPSLIGLLKLTLFLRNKKPDLIQTWLYHSDLVGGLAGKFAGNIRTYWSIRQSNIEVDSNKISTIWTAKACARLSSWLPEKIICCSHAAMKSHIALGYAREKMLVIPNGFDVDAFRPDKDARKSVREELGLDENTSLVGIVARFDPQKDHQNFIDAAGLIKKSDPTAHFILCGDGINKKNTRLAHWIEQANVEDRFHLLGIRQDVPRLIAAMDIAVSSSLGEGFPNVVGEAMACAVPCVVTDVGDSALIVGETGRVVAARDPKALAAEIIKLLRSPQGYREELGKQARLRVKNNYSLDSIVCNYEAVYRGAIND